MLLNIASAVIICRLYGIGTPKMVPKPEGSSKTSFLLDGFGATVNHICSLLHFAFH